MTRNISDLYPQLNTQSIFDDRIDTYQQSIGGFGGFRNKVINGNFNIWQRGTTFTTNGYTADRFRFAKNGTMAANVGLSGQVPLESGCNYSLYWQVTTAQESLGVSNYGVFEYMMEGYDLRPLVGKAVTLSFWVKSDVAGTYSVGIGNASGGMSWVSEYSINTADTWQKVVLTFQLNYSGGTWNYDNTLGLVIYFCLGSGSTHQTSSLDAWQSNFVFASSNQTSLFGTVGNVFRITEVQLEEGSIATTFEQRPIGIELELCQRYYEKSLDFNVTPANGLPYSPYLPAMAGASDAYTTIVYKVCKRVNPTITFYPPDIVGDTGQWAYYNGSSWTAGNASVLSRTNKEQTSIVVSGSYTVRDAYLLTGHWTADSEL